MWEISALRRGLRTSLGVGALALALVLPAAAAAATRYASPTGTNTADCLISAPCDLPNAMNGASTADNDDVIVLPGTYSLDGSNDVIDDSITVHGQAGQPLPRIQSSGGSEVLDLEDAVTVRRLWIDQTNSGGGNGIYIGNLGGGSLVEQTLIESTGSEACFLEVPSVTLSDTVCATRADGIAGLFAQANGGDTSTVTLRNVTAIASGQDEFSPAVLAISSGMNAHILIQGRNVLAAAGQFDVAADGHAGDATSSAAVSLTASNYDSQSELDGGTVTDPGTGGNQTAAPLLATDGFHQLAGSPTVDAGAAAPSLGSGDIDAEQRLAGTAVDIGADEFQPAAPPAGPTPPANPPPNQGPTAKCRGRTATIVATGGPVNGTPKRDVIVGSPRRDVIRAGRGADLVCARAGNDKVLGGPGPDTLLGQAGKDRLIGGGARDLLLGGPAIDVLLGGGGVDVLRGGPGRDVSSQ
jgi:Ca2+-binding RTX toxin-like protein